MKASLPGSLLVIAGTLLSTATVQADEGDVVRRSAAVIGTVLPPLGLSARTDFGWTAPRAPTAVAIAGGGEIADGDANRGLGRVLAQVSWRALSFEGRVATPRAGADRRTAVGPTTWLGGRVVIGERDDDSLLSGLYLRQAIPAERGSRSQTELGVAIGGSQNPMTWLLDVGVRARAGGFDFQSQDMVTPHVVGGVGVMPTAWLRLSAVGQLSTHFVGPFEDDVVGTSETGMQLGAAGHLGAELHLGSLLFATQLFAGTLAYLNGGDREGSLGAQGWVGYTVP